MGARQDYSSHEKIPNCFTQRVVGRVPSPVRSVCPVLHIRGWDLEDLFERDPPNSPTWLLHAGNLASVGVNHFSSSTAEGDVKTVES
jgi:hypothetical protein